MTAIAHEIQSDRAAYHSVVSYTTIMGSWLQTDSTVFTLWPLGQLSFWALGIWAHVVGSNLDHAVTSHLLKKYVLGLWPQHLLVWCSLDAHASQASWPWWTLKSSVTHYHQIRHPAKPNSKGTESVLCLAWVWNARTTLCALTVTCAFSFMLEGDVNTLRCHPPPATSTVNSFNVPCLLGGSCLGQGL